MISAFPQVQPTIPLPGLGVNGNVLVRDNSVANGASWSPTVTVSGGALGGTVGIGVAPASTIQLQVGGTFAPGSGLGLVRVSTSATIGANGNAEDLRLAGVYTTAASGTSPVVAGLRVNTGVTLTTGAAITDFAGVYVDALSVLANNAANASAIKVVAAPTGGTNSYAIWVAGGTSRFDGGILFPTSLTTPAGPSVGFSSNIAIYSGGSVATNWNSQSQATTLMTLTNAGSWNLSSSGPHAIGGATVVHSGLALTGTFDNTGVDPGQATKMLNVNPTIKPFAGRDAYLSQYAGTVNNPSGTTNLAASLIVFAPTLSGAGVFTNGAAAVIVGATTGATNNYALWVQAGNVKFNTEAFFTDAGGLQMGVPTGADKGLGTINVATNVFLNGTAYTNPDYVLEHWATGTIRRFADREGADRYLGLYPLSYVEAQARLFYALPRVHEARQAALSKPAGALGMFDGGDAVLASVEEAYLYLFDHEHQLERLRARIAELEGRLA